MKLLTCSEAAQVLGLNPGTVRVMIARRKLDVVRLGRSVRIPDTELARVIAANTTYHDPKWER